jgi:hypothetical protein
MLEAVAIEGRPAILLSREDITSGLLGVKCITIDGYTPMSANALMRNIVTVVTGRIGRPKTPPAPGQPQVYISDMLPVKATAGGDKKVMRDKSVDGNPLTLAGTPYKRGMGVHADSDLVFRLRPEYKRFTATVGVDDEVKEGGSIEFSVLVDDRTVAKSPVLKPSEVHKFDLEIPSGAVSIKLLTRSADGATTGDHGDWADAGFLSVLKPTSRPVGLPEFYISDMTPTKVTLGWGENPGIDKSIDGNPITIKGKIYPRGVGTHAVSKLVYKLNPDFKRFVATVGIDDEVQSKSVKIGGKEIGPSVVFQVVVDGDIIAKSPLMKPLEVYHFNVDLPEEGKVITLVATDGGDRFSYDHADWANAGFLTTKKPVPEAPGEGTTTPVKKPSTTTPVKKPPATKPPVTKPPVKKDPNALPDWMKKGAEKSVPRGWLIPEPKKKPVPKPPVKKPPLKKTSAGYEQGPPAPGSHGYVKQWLVSGPYPGKEGHDTAFAPEKTGGGARWKPLTAGIGETTNDLCKGLATKKGQSAAYVKTWIYSPKGGPVRLEMASDDSMKAWVNGKKIHEYPRPRSMARGTKDIVKTTLKAGWNPVMLKIYNGTAQWGFGFRVCAPDGGEIKGLKASATRGK